MTYVEITQLIMAAYLIGFSLIVQTKGFAATLIFKVALYFIGIILILMAYKLY